MAVHSSPVVATPGGEAPPPEPVVVTDSDSDADTAQQLSNLESWVRTPEDSPPARSSRHPVYSDTHPAPDGPPPEYTEYLQPTIESFGFHPDVATFLSQHNLSSAGLARIDRTLNCHLNDWEIGFREAGLCRDDAQKLRAVVVQSLPDLSKDALLTAWAAGDR